MTLNYSGGTHVNPAFALCEVNELEIVNAEMDYNIVEASGPPSVEEETISKYSSRRSSRRTLDDDDDEIITPENLHLYECVNNTEDTPDACSNWGFGGQKGGASNTRNGSWVADTTESRPNIFKETYDDNKVMHYNYTLQLHTTTTHYNYTLQLYTTTTHSWTINFIILFLLKTQMYILSINNWR